MRPLPPLSRPFGRALIVACAALVAACHDQAVAPRPATPFDAQHAIGKVSPLTAVFEQDIFASFDVTLDFTGGYFDSGTAASGDLAPHFHGFDTRVTRTLAPVTRLNASGIPTDVRGKTFIYDVTTHTYVVDPTATGAPSSGVRYVMYRWFAGTGGPEMPLTRIGYVDIAPVGTGIGSPQMTQVVVKRDTPALTAADFVVVHGTNAGTATFGITGSATDGTTRVDVNLAGTYGGATGAHQLVFNTALSSSALDVSTIEQLTFDQATASQGGRLELHYDGHKFSDDAAPSGLGRELKFDGELYARVVVSNQQGDGLQYLKPDGTSLTTQEIVDLNDLLNGVVATNFFWINLAWP